MQNLKNQNFTGVKKGPFYSRVLENEKISQGIYKLKIENSEIAGTAFPGQFVSLRCADLTLRRPFSVAGVHENTFDLIYKIKGTGTEWLTTLKKGSIVDLIGPMGNGYRTENKKSLLIGCGVGIAPIDFLADVLKQKGFPYKIIGSFKNSYKTDKKYDYLITEDGSSDITGRLDDHLERIIAEVKPKKINMCGPNPAMKYVCEIAQKYSIEIEVALEGDFACGTGVCMGCAMKIKRNGKSENARICKDGPVFNGEEIIWL